MKSYTHGGDIFSYYNKYGKYPVDFSSSLNPYAENLNLKATFINSYDKCFIYPPYDYKVLCEKLAEKENVKVENICLSNGASEIIRFIPLVFESSKPLLLCPAFSEYEKSLKNKNILRYTLKEENNFLLDELFLPHIKLSNIVFITNPDNPVGNVISYDLMEKIAYECKKHESLLVIDECFMELSENNFSAVSLINKYDNIIIIKAFTKTYALAGLRLGYAISHEKNIDKLLEYLPEWRVSFPAYLCGIKALEEKDFVKNSIEYINKEKDYLKTHLLSFGFKIYGSKSNYIFFKSDIYNLKAELEKYGILIRDCSNYYGLAKGYYRVAVKKHSDNEQLIKGLKGIING